MDIVDRSPGAQGVSEYQSKPKFTATEAGVEKRLVEFFVGDDEADWLLHEAMFDGLPSRALATLKRVAPRLGFLQADRGWGENIFMQAVAEAGSRNGLGRGDDEFETTWREVEPLIQEGFMARAAELGAPRMEMSRADVLSHLEWHKETPKQSRVLFRDYVAGVALDRATDTDLPLEAILDDLSSVAGLTVEELASPHDGPTPWREAILDDMQRKRWDAEARRPCNIEGRKAPRLIVNPLAEANRRERFEITMFGDLDEAPAKDWLVDDLLGAGEFSCFWGMPGCGKSVIVGDAAFHIASGLPWHGKDVKRGLVVFIAAERADLTKRRFAALRKRYGGDKVPLAVVKGRLDMTASVEDAKDIVAAVQGLEERTGEQCVWVVIDTIARTFGAGDENKQADMGAYVKACDLIRDELSAHVTVIHHCSRSGEKPRGSIALDGAVDATFRVAKTGPVHSVTIDKENDAPEGGVIRFRMEGVELGTDSKGKVTTAPIAVQDTDTVVAFEKGGVSVALTSKPRRAVVVLQEAIAASDEVSPDGRRAVDISDLRRRLSEAFAGPRVKPDSLAAIVRKHVKSLMDRGEAVRHGEWIMLPHPLSTPGGREQGEEP